MSRSSSGAGFGLFAILLIIALIIGEIRCYYQFFTSDFKPSYKREIIYGIGLVGPGAVIGWFNIPDAPPDPTSINVTITSDSTATK